LYKRTAISKVQIKSSKNINNKKDRKSKFYSTAGHENLGGGV
jgi:hypothetical protein